MKINLKKIIPHLIVCVVFLIAALSYFNPILSGKKLYQNDIVQYQGNARQLIEHRQQTGQELYWTDAIFGGMPTYQLGARYPYDFIDSLDRTLRFLPRPADYLFLYFISFYILMLVLRVNWKFALIGSLAFGFSTYLIIILGVGHNSKAHAIAYFPLVLSGIFLAFQQRYLLGFVITAIAMALELQANHLQMTYYLLLSVIILGIVYLINAIRNQQLTQYLKTIGILTLAVVLALGTNAGNLLATSQYSSESTRGASDLTINAQGENISPTKGLDYNYITEYSYGITESLNLLVPRFAGGGSSARPDSESNTVTYLINQGVPKSTALEIVNQSVPLYWGDQTIVEAPPYLGIGVVFLAIVGLLLINNKLRWWTASVIILSLLLSYGKNADWLTRLFIDYVPFYNKFRAITSIQVLIELCIPILAVMGLWHIFSSKTLQTHKLHALKYASLTLGGLLLILVLLGGQLFDFAGPYDQYYISDLGLGFVDALRQDRLSIMRSDAILALAITGVIATILYLYITNKIKQNLSLIIITIVIITDLIIIDSKYVNSDDYVTASEYANAHYKSPADDIAIQAAAKGDHFRVYDQLTNPFNSARAPYYHKALGGYHGAKPRRIQDIIDFYLTDDQGRVTTLNNQNAQVLSMFNVRYIIDSQDQDIIARQNPMAMGNAWFVDSLLVVNNNNEEILSLKQLNGKSIAVIQRDQQQLLDIYNTAIDTTASIDLIDYHPQQLVYRSQHNHDALAVFSEMYYPHGWTATIDGQPVPIARVNYTLRGIKVPAGDHEIVFNFKPQVVITGSNIMLASNILLFIIVIGGMYYTVKKS